MLHIRVVAVGKLKERFWADACSEYLKRLRPYANVEVVEISDVDPGKAGGEQKAIASESRAILDALSPDELVVLLDIDGKLVTSEQIASELERFPHEGINDIALVIGGSCGVSEDVRKRAQQRWSLGRITLPHNLARVVLLEQVYRAFKIIRHEPYHK